MLVAVQSREVKAVLGTICSLMALQCPSNNGPRIGNVVVHARSVTLWSGIRASPMVSVSLVVLRFKTSGASQIEVRIFSNKWFSVQMNGPPKN
jgi:hypothetical protein